MIILVMEKATERAALKLKERDIRHQNLWTALSIILAILTHFIPAHTTLAVSVVQALRYVFSAFAFICLVGSIYIYMTFKYLKKITPEPFRPKPVR